MHASTIISIFNKIDSEDLYLLIDKDTDMEVLTKKLLELKGKNSITNAWIAYAYKNRNKNLTEEVKKCIKSLTLEELEEITNYIEIKSKISEKDLFSNIKIELANVFKQELKEIVEGLVKDLKTPIFLFDDYNQFLCNFTDKLFTSVYTKPVKFSLYDPNSFSLVTNVIVTDSSVVKSYTETVELEEFKKQTGFSPPKNSFWKRVKRLVFFFNFSIDAKKSVLEMDTSFDFEFFPYTKYTIKDKWQENFPLLRDQFKYLFQSRQFPIKLYIIPKTVPFEKMIEEIKSKEMHYV